MMLDGFGSFEDEDDDDDACLAVILPDEEVMPVARETYQVGNLAIPDWLMDGIARQHILFRNDACDVLVRGRYIRAHKGDYIIRIGTTFTIDPAGMLQ